MSNTSIYPTFTNFISNDKKFIERKFLEFLTSEYSQSSFALGQVESFRYLIYIEKDINKLVELIRDSLLRLYHNYYDNVDILIEKSEPDDDNFIDLKIDIIVENDDQQITFSEIISTNDKNPLTKLKDETYIIKGVY